MSKITEIVCIIDMSGSMMSIKDDSIGGFNSFIEEQKKLDGETRITVALFDDQYELLADGIDLKEFEGLNDSNYRPRGMTALLDAIGKTVTNIDSKEDFIPVEIDYVVAILTDGAENCSREFNRDGIFKLISDKTEEGWQFIYLGANQDAIGEATSLGIKGLHAGNFVASGDGASTAVLNASEMIAGYRSAGFMMSYDDASSLRTGDKE